MSKFRFKVSDIQWETDGENPSLPKSVEFKSINSDTPEQDEELICDYLSDHYGWLVNNFNYTKESIHD